MRSFIQCYMDSSFYCRIWDTRTMTEVKNVDIPQNATSMLLCKDDNVLIVTYGTTVSFWDAER